MKSLPVEQFFISFVLLAFLFGPLVPIINYHLLKVLTWAFVICRLILRIVFVMNSLRKYSPTQPLFVVVTQRAFSSTKRWADWATRPYNVAAKETSAQEQKSLNPNLGCEMVCSLLGVVYPSNLSINITICFEPSLSMILYLSVKNYSGMNSKTINLSLKCLIKGNDTRKY